GGRKAAEPRPSSRRRSSDPLIAHPESPVSIHTGHARARVAKAGPIFQTRDASDTPFGRRVSRAGGEAGRVRAGHRGPPFSRMKRPGPGKSRRASPRDLSILSRRRQARTRFLEEPRHPPVAELDLNLRQSRPRKERPPTGAGRRAAPEGA